ncbi:hypothetical protein PoB_006366100 [Plakobranchus ocellatus]|uniref:Uncharacterized protein n=1 Tax=Plakobranchus ocellatus TaxID=259542 RepID=A0AAV4CZI8_9GAST|nr:hypothetical protein PoB_006366100 [Plakobranchus ocellatus]
MEVEASQVMWGHSMARNLRYTTLISDVDSKIHNELLRLDPYPGTEVVKIGLLQAHYKRAVASKCMSTAELRKILCTLKHCSSSDDNPQHDDCPTGKDSWCFYQCTLAYGRSPPSYQGKSSCYLNPHVAGAVIHQKTAEDNIKTVHISLQTMLLKLSTSTYPHSGAGPPIMPVGKKDTCSTCDELKTQLHKDLPGAQLADASVRQELHLRKAQTLQQKDCSLPRSRYRENWNGPFLNAVLCKPESKINRGVCPSLEPVNNTTLPISAKKFQDLLRIKRFLPVTSLRPSLLLCHIIDRLLQIPEMLRKITQKSVTISHWLYNDNFIAAQSCGTA